MINLSCLVVLVLGILQLLGFCMWIYISLRVAVVHCGLTMTYPIEAKFKVFSMYCKISTFSFLCMSTGSSVIYWNEIWSFQSSFPILFFNLLSLHSNVRTFLLILHQWLWTESVSGFDQLELNFQVKPNSGNSDDHQDGKNGEL